LRLLRWAAAALLLVVFGACFLAYLLYRPYKNFEGATFVDLPKGTSTAEMADLLERAGVVQHSWQFLLARALRRNATLKAGEYRFEKAASTFDVFDRIARGDIFYYELVVPEGKNIFDMAGAVEKMGLFSAEKFLAAARDPGAIADLDARAHTLEGYLFPNTYRLDRHITPERLCHLMTSRFREAWRELHVSAGVHETVTLASLIEKEARVPQDRPLISSVFHNRLKRGMKLDCDPTAVYAAQLEGRYRGGIHKSDLDSANPYNTYRHAGLPPGPIANPGITAIQAASHPAATDYLYFVLRPDGSGAHNFSTTISAHQAATTEYRRANHPAQIQEEPPPPAHSRKKSKRHR